MRRPFLFASITAASLTISSLALADFATPPGEVAVAQPAAPTLAVAAPLRDVAVAKAREGVPMLLSLGFDGGPVYVPARGFGGYGRFVIEALAVPSPRKVSPVFGVWETIEGWGGPFKSSGIGVAIAGQAGLRAGPFTGTVVAGFNVLTYERFIGAEGFGGFSPRAGARLALNLGPVRVAASGDVQRRWQTRIPTTNMLQAGLEVAWLLDKSTVK